MIIKASVSVLALCVASGAYGQAAQTADAAPAVQVLAQAGGQDSIDADPATIAAPAQTAPAEETPQPAESEAGGEIVVTGSRLPSGSVGPGVLSPSLPTSSSSSSSKTSAMVELLPNRLMPARPASKGGRSGADSARRW